jgi:cyanophycin synthetase
VLETTVRDSAILAAWRERALAACAELRWPAAKASAVSHAGGASLAVSAPVDQLFTATEVNEWALAASIAGHDPSQAPSLVAALAAEQPEESEPPTLAAAGALLRLRRRAALEANPKLRALIETARARALPWLLDDEALTPGATAGRSSSCRMLLPSPGTACARSRSHS